MANRRFYWLKLKEDFFEQKEIKKLRKIAGGDTYVVIYLKMLLLAIKNNGEFIFEGFEDNVCNELALELDEDEENVNVTFNFLKRYNLVEEVTPDSFYFSKIKELTGSETASTIRSRKSRERKSVAMQQNCNMLQQNCNVEREKDIELDIEKDIELEKEERHSLSLVSKNSLSQLSQEQYNYLIKKYPVDLVNRTVEKAQKYKGCYTLETIEKWIKEKIEQPKPVNTVYSKKTMNKFNDFHQRDYSQDEMNELEKRLLSK